MKRLAVGMLLVLLTTAVAGGIGRALSQRPHEPPGLETLRALDRDGLRSSGEAQAASLELLARSLVGEEGVVFARGHAADGTPRALVVTFEIDPLTRGWRPMAEHDAPAEDFVAIPVWFSNGDVRLAYANLPAGVGVVVGETVVVVPGGPQHGLAELPRTVDDQSPIRLIEG